MINIYENKLKVSASMCDVNVQMGLLQSMQVAQDNMCEYYKNIGCDGLTMAPICNCFFVVSKIKIHFQKYLSWLDEFSTISELVELSRIKMSLETEFKDKAGSVFATCVHQMCAMDSDTRALRAVNTTLVPTDLETTKSTPIQFTKFNAEMTDENYVKTISIELPNVDFYRHTNNVEYVRLILSCLDVDFMDNYFISDFEIHYLAESKFGEKLALYKKVLGDEIFFEIRREDKVINKSVMKVIKR